MSRFFTSPFIWTSLLALMLSGVFQQSYAGLINKSTKKSLFVYYEQSTNSKVEVLPEAGTMIYSDRLGYIIDPNMPKIRTANLKPEFKSTVRNLIVANFQHTSEEAIRIATDHQKKYVDDIVKIVTKTMKDKGINFGVFRFNAQVFLKGETSNCPSEISWKMIFESNERYKFTAPMVQNACFTYVEANYIAFKSADNVRGKDNLNIQLKNAGILSWKVYRKDVREIYDTKRKGIFLTGAQIQVNGSENFDNIDENTDTKETEYKATWHKDCLYNTSKYPVGGANKPCPVNFTYVDTSIPGGATTKEFKGFKEIMNDFNANFVDLKYSKKLEIKQEPHEQCEPKKVINPKTNLTEVVYECEYLVQPTFTKRHISYPKDSCSVAKKANYETEYYWSYQLVSKEDFYRATQEATDSNFDSGLSDAQKGFQTIYEGKVTDIKDTTLLQNATSDSNNPNLLCKLDSLNQCKKTNVVVNDIEDTVLIDKLKNSELDVVLAPVQVNRDSPIEYVFRARVKTNPMAQIKKPEGNIVVNEIDNPDAPSGIFVCDERTAGQKHFIGNTSYIPRYAGSDRTESYFLCDPTKPKNEQEFYTTARGGDGFAHYDRTSFIDMTRQYSNNMATYDLRPHWGGRPNTVKSSFSVTDTCNDNDNLCGIRFHFTHADANSNGANYMDMYHKDYTKMVNPVRDACGSKVRACDAPFSYYCNGEHNDCSGSSGWRTIKEPDVTIYPNQGTNEDGVPYSTWYGNDSDGGSGYCYNVREECVPIEIPNIEFHDFKYCMGEQDNSNGNVNLTKQYKAIENGNTANPVNILLYPIQ